ncbi:glycosyltransferase family 2 protein [Methylobacter sp. sgz302048]|uniref:glycosyltransferase family 2 protein n=1 Tax=Methylobacter sp. sgz302048 TaxID=3455945 RepID=UPI003FA0CD89
MPEKNSLGGVSVVIPTINRAAVLADTVRDMLKQQFDDYEILIVDQSDEINEEVLSLAKQSTQPRIRYFKANFKGLPQARNFGWRHAAKDVVLYIDDDIRTGSGLVRSHFDSHIKTGADMVAGGIDEAAGDKPCQLPTGSFNWWTATATRNFSATTSGWCLHAPGGNFSIRRSVLDAVGGIDEVLSIGAALYEESELALRLYKAGKRTWFEPSARLLHLAAPMGGCRVTKDWPKYMFGLAHNRSILIFRHLKPWHRPTALLRLLMLGLSYSRLDQSPRPLLATLRGLTAGRRAAAMLPLNAELDAIECTSC